VYRPLAEELARLQALVAERGAGRRVTAAE
jgi:hypothetical protein